MHKNSYWDVNLVTRVQYAYKYLSKLFQEATSQISDWFWSDWRGQGHREGSGEALSLRSEQRAQTEALQVFIKQDKTWVEKNNNGQ